MIIDDAFAYWAFGLAWNGYKSLELDITDMLDAWNEKHKELFEVNEQSNIFHSLVSMRKIYDDLHREEIK